MTSTRKYDQPTPSLDQASHNETPRDSASSKADRRVKARYKAVKSKAKYQMPKLGISMPANAVSIAQSTRKYTKALDSQRPTVKQTEAKKASKRTESRKTRKSLAKGRNLYKSFQTSMSKQPYRPF